jgi:phospholipid transport system substrate-binding protein
MKTAQSIYRSSNPGRRRAAIVNNPSSRQRFKPGLSRFAVFMSSVLLVMSAMAGSNDTTQSSPEQMVKQTAEQVLNRLQQDRTELKAHPGRIYALIKNIILPHFDFRRMSQWVLGVNWRRATPEQRKRFMHEFRDLLVNTYGYALLRYENETIQYLPTRKDQASGEVLVRTQIQQADGESIPVNYRLYNKQGEWKVFDLSIDGVSLVSNYRNSFDEQIQQIGMDGLIKRLEQHNQQSTG